MNSISSVWKPQSCVRIMDADITVDAVRAGKIGNEGEAGFNTCQLVTYRGGKREVWTDIEAENLVSLIAANKVRCKAYSCIPD